MFNDQNIIDDINITLSNQVKLNESPFFKEFKKLKLNFMITLAAIAKFLGLAKSTAQANILPLQPIQMLV